MMYCHLPLLRPPYIRILGLLVVWKDVGGMFSTTLRKLRHMSRISTSLLCNTLELLAPNPLHLRAIYKNRSMSRDSELLDKGSQMHKKHNPG